MMTTKIGKSELSDSELVQLYRSHQEGAFAELVRRHKDRLFTAIYLIVKDQYVAEDILQETFIKAIDTIRSGKYNDEGKFLPWISRIAHNMAIDHFRRHKRYPTLTVEDGSNLFNNLSFSDDSYESICVKTEVHAQLRETIKKLPKAQREVLIMRHYFQMSFQEIAEQTQVSINTALGRMRYALINLRKLMNKDQAYAGQETNFEN
jgi:RNA polymerase sigma-70 factor (ECF subfamily)